jgi:hypothetical protein
LDLVNKLLPKAETFNQTGVIIGAVKIGGHVTAAEGSEDAWSFGPFCNIITDSVEFSKAKYVCCKGALSCFPLKPDNVMLATRYTALHGVARKLTVPPRLGAGFHHNI